MAYKSKVMPKQKVRRKKPELSAHQKEIRFLTGLSVLVSFLFTMAFFLFMNRASFSHH